MITANILILVIIAWLFVIVIHGFYYMLKYKEVPVRYTTFQEQFYKVVKINNDIIVDDHFKESFSKLDQERYKEMLVREGSHKILREAVNYISITKGDENDPLHYYRRYPGEVYHLELIIGVK